MDYWMEVRCCHCENLVAHREKLSRVDFRVAIELKLGKIKDNIYILRGRICEECRVERGGIKGEGES